MSVEGAPDIRPIAVRRRGAALRPAALVSTGLASPLLRLAAALALLALTLLPRLAAREVFVTADEDNWLMRGANFRLALEAGDWPGTYQNGHPGVTTMWLVAAALDSESARTIVDGAAQSERQFQVLTGFPSFMEHLARARLVFGLATALLLLVLLGVLALHVGWWPAWLATLLIGWDPFLLALSRAVHVDALLTLCATIALLAALAFWRGRAGWPLLALAAVSTALAVLSKSPGLALAGAIPALALWCWRGQRPRRSHGWLLASLAAWGGLTLLVGYAAWPALWRDPLGTSGRMLGFALTQGETPEGLSFFLGQAVVDPGPLFYPAALLLRATPVLCLGLVAAVWQRLRRPAADHTSGLGLPLLGWALLFLLLMSLGAKKMDRYLVPVVPALYILATLGLLATARWLSTRSPWLGGAAVAAALALQLGGLIATQPYYSTFYNPLLGGAPVARQVMTIGWGEGMDQVAAYLNSRPNAERLRVVAQNFDALRAQYVGRGEPLRDTTRARVEYLVLSVAGVQQRKHAEAYERYLQGATLEFTARIGGVDYAWVYRLPAPRP